MSARDTSITFTGSYTPGDSVFLGNLVFGSGRKLTIAPNVSGFAAKGNLDVLGADAELRSPHDFDARGTDLLFALRSDLSGATMLAVSGGGSVRCSTRSQTFRLRLTAANPSKS